MSGPRLAIFDCDGTLVDSQYIIAASLARAFAATGWAAPPHRAVRSVIGLTLADAVRELAPERAGEAEVARATKTYLEAFEAARRAPDFQEPMFPGVLEILNTLEADGFVLAVATGKSRRGLDHVLKHHGLERRFAVLTTADDHPSKPHPGMIETCLAMTGTRPARAVMIGDTHFDMAMARAAGVFAIGVKWGYHSPAMLMGAGAHRLVEEAGEIAATAAALVGSGDQG